MLSLGFALLSLFFFLGYFLVGHILYKKRMNSTYSIRNCFPFEFNYKVTFKENFYTYLFLILFIASGLGFFATYNLKFNNGFIVFAMIGGLLTTIAVLLILIVPLTSFRFHLLVTIIFFVLNFAVITSIFISGLREYSEFKLIKDLIGSIVTGILAVSSFAITMNPKISLDIKAEQKVNDKGEVELQRPKRVVIACSEWLQLFLYISNMLAMLIFLIPNA